MLPTLLRAEAEEEPDPREPRLEAEAARLVLANRPAEAKEATEANVELEAVETETAEDDD